MNAMFLSLLATLACAGPPEAGPPSPSAGAAVSDPELALVMAQSPPDAAVKPWTKVDVPGWRLFTVGDERGVGGAAVEVGGQTVQLKDQAMIALMAAGVQDAARLAQLSALFLDGGPDLWEPLADPQSVPEDLQARASLVTAPSRQGDTLVYWREGDRPRDLVRVEVNLASMQATRSTASALAQQAEVAADPIAAARADLTSANKYTQLRGVQTLAACPGPEAATLLVQAMLTAKDPGVREAATKAQAGCPAPESVREMSRVLAGDASVPVRIAAANTLGALGDASARKALESAAETDNNGDVRFAARKALEAL